MEPIQVLAGTLETMQAAWNRGDAVAFGALFTDDAEFVDIRGGYHRGRVAIEQGHAGIFATIYKGSRLTCRPLDARAIASDVIIAHGCTELVTTSGMLAGKTALHTLVFVKKNDRWLATAFHNMIIADGQPLPR